MVEHKKSHESFHKARVHGDGDYHLENVQWPDGNSSVTKTEMVATADLFWCNIYVMREQQPS